MLEGATWNVTTVATSKCPKRPRPSVAGSNVLSGQTHTHILHHSLRSHSQGQIHRRRLPALCRGERSPCPGEDPCLCPAPSLSFQVRYVALD